MDPIIMTIISVVAILSLFIGLPSVVMFFIYKIIKSLTEKGKIKHQEKLLELELEQQRNQIRLLEEESKKYDKIINNL